MTLKQQLSKVWNDTRNTISKKFDIYLKKIKAYLDLNVPIWKARFKLWRIKKHKELKEYLKKKFPKKPSTKSSKFFERFEKIVGICLIGLLILIYLVGLPSLPVSLTDFIGSDWFWISIGSILLSIIVYSIWKSSKKVSTTSTPSTVTPKSKTASKPWTLSGTAWAITKVVISLGMIVLVVCIVWTVVIDFIPRHPNPYALRPTIKIDRMTYGTYHINEDKPRIFARTENDYFYPAIPGTTITLRISPCDDPTLYCDYRCTRQLDGSIRPEDNQFFGEYKLDRWGDHTVTLLAQSTDVVYSDHPLQK